MRASTIRVLTFVGVAILASQPTTLLAQSRRAGMVLQATVPSIVKYVVDETSRAIDGSPTIRVITNDPAIRAAFARGVPAELVGMPLASSAPEASGHAKGGEVLEAATARPVVRRYTVVAP